jgi:hypothetical protein
VWNNKNSRKKKRRKDSQLNYVKPGHWHVCVAAKDDVLEEQVKD